METKHINMKKVNKECSSPVEKMFDKLDNPELVRIDRDFESVKTRAAFEKARIERAHKMQNIENKFVYDTKLEVLHDRNCALVEDIKDIDFETITYIPTNMKLCKRCRVRALVRNAIDDPVNINSAIHFFNMVKAKYDDLYRLLSRDDVILTYNSPMQIQLHVKEDTWIVEMGINAKHLILRHNNYVSYDGFQTRKIQDGFHRQGPKNADFQKLCNVMLNYKWKNHRSIVIKAGTKALRKAPENYVPKPIVETSNEYAAIKLDERMFWYNRYLFIDTKKHYSTQVFKEYKINSKLISETEYPDVNYVAIVCDIPKWQKRRLPRAFDQINALMCTDGDSHALECCEAVKDTLKKNGVAFREIG